MAIRLNDPRKGDYNMKHILAAIAATILILLAWENAPDRTDIDSDRITEDDPRWDCETMGNRICGPIAP